jgi:hypothetical protein
MVEMRNYYNILDEKYEGNVEEGELLAGPFTNGSERP